MPSLLLASEPAAIGRIHQFEVEHWSFLALAVICVIAAVPLARRYPHILTTAGWIFLAATVFWTAWGFFPAVYRLDESLPFHYSDLLRFITSIALITRARWAVSVTIFWGLTINLMSLISPDLIYYTLPWLEASFYWFLHIGVLVAAAVFVFSVNCRPGPGDIAITWFITIAWGILCLAVNQFTGTNYGYLSRAPAVDSILDHLGGWPFYIVAEVFLLGAAWVLMAVGINRRNTRYTSNTRKVMANSTEESSISPAP